MYIISSRYILYFFSCSTRSASSLVYYSSNQRWTSIFSAFAFVLYSKSKSFLTCSIRVFTWRNFRMTFTRSKKRGFKIKHTLVHLYLCYKHKSIQRQWLTHLFVLLDSFLFQCNLIFFLVLSVPNSIKNYLHRIVTVQLHSDRHYTSFFSCFSSAFLALLVASDSPWTVVAALFR